MQTKKHVEIDVAIMRQSMGNITNALLLLRADALLLLLLLHSV